MTRQSSRLLGWKTIAAAPMVLGWLGVVALVLASDGVCLSRVALQRPNVAWAVANPEVQSLPPSLSNRLGTPVQVPGGYPVSLTAVVGGSQVKASWTYVDGLPVLNSQLDSWVLGTLDAAAARAGGRYRPAMALNATQSPGPVLTVSAQPVRSVGTVVVFREEVSETGSDGRQTESSETVYADTVSGEVHRAAELLRPEALDANRSRVAGVPAAIIGPPGQQPPISDIVLEPSGDLHIIRNRAAGHARPGQQDTGTIAAPDAEAMLSDVGRKIQDQLRASPAPPPATPPALRHVNCDIVPCAALTYDDGPDAKTTPQLLSVLKQNNAQATFFMTGSNAVANPTTARQVADAGHAVGNHTYSHPYLTKLSPAAVRSEMDRTDAAIRAATGSSPLLMRPPYGAADATVQSAVGKPLILWAVDSLDWQSKNPGVFVPKVLKEIVPGAVVLMHDVDTATVAGQQELISNLQAQGYRLVTVPQLFEGTPLVSGHVYRARPERR